jgi:hypothetical protein
MKDFVTGLIGDIDIDITKFKKYELLEDNTIMIYLNDGISFIYRKYPTVREAKLAMDDLSKHIKIAPQFGGGI